jgi:hypothetical protein
MMLRRLKVWWLLRPRRSEEEQHWIQYGCRFNGEVINTYPTQAAMENDPIFVRGNGARSVGRDMVGGQPVSEWRPVFAGDVATHRYQAGSEE